MNVAATIIVPLKRQQDAWLSQCVRSAVTQSAPCEVIVVRSEATPRSNIQVLESIQTQWPNLRVVLEEAPGSFPAALNLGIRSAGSERIGLLLSDDWLETDAVACCLELSADIVCTGLTAYYEDGLTILEGASQTLTIGEYNARSSLEAKAAYLEHFFLFRRNALVQAGGLDESIGNFPGIDDYDLIWTLLEQGASVGIVEQRLYNYRDHSGERLTLADKAQATRNLEKILRKHGVPQPEIPRLLADQSRWFGRAIHQVLNDANTKLAPAKPQT